MRPKVFGNLHIFICIAAICLHVCSLRICLCARVSPAGVLRRTVLFVYSGYSARANRDNWSHVRPAVGTQNVTLLLLLVRLCLPARLLLACSFLHSSPKMADRHFTAAAVAWVRVRGHNAISCAGFSSSFFNQMELANITGGEMGERGETLTVERSARGRYELVQLPLPSRGPFSHPPPPPTPPPVPCSRSPILFPVGLSSLRACSVSVY